MASRLDERPIKSVSDYLNNFSDIVETWTDPEEGEVRPWCRGQADASWGLVPGEYRLGHFNSHEVRSEFELKALPLLRQVPKTAWEWYFLMQHHGLPTRLLDWTTGSLLALYFALRVAPGRADAAVWVLNPWALNKKSTRSSNLLLAQDKAAGKYLPAVYATTTKIPELPVAIAPPYNSNRITVQRGTFTIHGSRREGLEKLFGDGLVKIVIPQNRALQVKRDLRLAGVGEFTVFPELDGLCAEIRAAEIEGC